MSYPQIIAIILFLITYIFIATEKIHKTLAALFGGFLMVMLHFVRMNYAFSHIDFNVIFLLIGMMIIVKILEETGGFEYIAIRMTKMVHADPGLTMVVLFLVTAVFSAFVDNITTVLLITPISILIAKEMKISPLPFFITQIFGSNIGGTATLIGDPPNIMIGSSANLTFVDFISNTAPVILIQLVVFSFIFLIVFGKKMHVRNEDRARILDFEEKKMITNPKLLLKSLIIFGLIIIGFMIHGILELEASVIALTGAALLMIVSKIKPEKIFKEIEWNTIFFFIGLFLLVAGIIETGWIDLVSVALLKLTNHDLKMASKLILWFSGIFSAFVDNIPYVATMIPLIKNLGANVDPVLIKPLWWSLSLGACLGGNGSLIGASANVIIADFSKKTDHPITFFGFFKYSIPITLLSLAISYIYLIVRYY